jgi:hypothetical protein
MVPGLSKEAYKKATKMHNDIVYDKFIGIPETIYDEYLELCLMNNCDMAKAIRALHNSVSSSKVSSKIPDVYDYVSTMIKKSKEQPKVTAEPKTTKETKAEEPKAAEAQPEVKKPAEKPHDSKINMDTVVDVDYEEVNENQNPEAEEAQLDTVIYLPAGENPEKATERPKVTAEPKTTKETKAEEPKAAEAQPEVKKPAATTGKSKKRNANHVTDSKIIEGHFGDTEPQTTKETKAEEPKAAEVQLVEDEKNVASNPFAMLADAANLANAAAKLYELTNIFGQFLIDHGVHFNEEGECSNPKLDKALGEYLEKTFTDYGIDAEDPNFAKNVDALADDINNIKEEILSIINSNTKDTAITKETKAPVMPTAQANRIVDQFNASATVHEPIKVAKDVNGFNINNFVKEDQPQQFVHPFAQPQVQQSQQQFVAPNMPNVPPQPANPVVPNMPADQNGFYGIEGARHMWDIIMDANNRMNGCADPNCSCHTAAPVVEAPVVTEVPTPVEEKHELTKKELDALMNKKADYVRKHIEFIDGKHCGENAVTYEQLDSLYSLIKDNVLKPMLKKYKSKAKANNPHLYEVEPSKYHDDTDNGIYDIVMECPCADIDGCRAKIVIKYSMTPQWDESKQQMYNPLKVYTVKSKKGAVKEKSSGQGDVDFKQEEVETVEDNK